MTDSPLFDQQEWQYSLYRMYLELEKLLGRSIA